MSKHTPTLLIIFLITLFPIFQYQPSPHPTLQKSTPQHQPLIKHKPQPINLHFNQPLNTKYSTLTLFHHKPKNIKQLKPITTPSSHTLLFSSQQILNPT
ncbi:copper resistance protein CopC, partial [Staphylococcus epidermidis]|uniref:copper resistance protein CopC n=1 Tax=Staphylococcus epidermidis TaxID=1282 RepID=UPI0037DA1591